MEIGSRRVLGHDLRHPACGTDIRLQQNFLWVTKRRFRVKRYFQATIFGLSRIRHEGFYVATSSFGNDKTSLEYKERILERRWLLGSHWSSVWLNE
jgi:hypothetical protein